MCVIVCSFYILFVYVFLSIYVILFFDLHYSLWWEPVLPGPSLLVEANNGRVKRKAALPASEVAVLFPSSGDVAVLAEKPR